MILGASHIVLTTARPEEDEAALVALGWKTRFRENVSARSGKAPFLTVPSPGEQLTLLDRPGQVAIELITYRETASADSVASLTLPNGNAGSGGAGSLPGGEPYFSVPEQMSSVLVLRAPKLDPVERFWVDVMGFSVQSADEARAFGATRELALRRPLAHWSLRFFLVEDSNLAAEVSTLDAAGVRCVSFISSDLGADRRKLLNFPDVESTGPMRYEISGKSMEIEIFLAPGGLFVELLQPAAPREATKEGRP